MYIRQFGLSRILHCTNPCWLCTKDRVTIKSSHDAFKILIKYWDHTTIEFVEEFKLLLLNRSNKILGIAELFKGGTTGTVVDPRIVYQYALKSNASNIILSHNHPSGNIKPSQADINITRKLKEGAELLNIQLLDHLIISHDETYYSFADEGLLWYFGLVAKHGCIPFNNSIITLV